MALDLDQKEISYLSILNFYQLLYIASPSIISISLMSYFFRSVFKRRHEIRELEERKRQIATIKGSLQAYNLFNDEDETKKVMNETILKLRDATVSAYQGSEIDAASPEGESDLDNKSLLDAISKLVKMVK